MKLLACSIVLAAALVAAPAQPAGAAVSGEAITASIRHADLDLNTSVGRETFRGRVKAAANRVCGIAPALPFYESDGIEACRAQLFRSAEGQVTLALARAGSTDVVGTR